MDKNKISHDILNILERLRIMHDLLKRADFSDISRDEINRDLEVAMKDLKEKFQALAQ